MATFSDIYFEQLETAEVEHCEELEGAFRCDPGFAEGYDSILDEMKDYVITGEVADVGEFANKVGELETRFEYQTHLLGERQAVEMLYEVYSNMLYIFA